MKIKPAYIYLGVVVAAIAVLIILLNTNKPETKIPPAVTGEQMPQDDIHKGMQNPQGAPGKDNVTENVRKKIEELNKAVTANPNDTVALREYADFLAAAHRPDESVQYYERILKKDPARTDILFSLAFVYYNKQKYDEAEKITNRIIKLDKNNLQAQYNLGAIAASRGDKAKAKEIWTKLAHQYPATDIGATARESLTRL